MLRDKDIRVRFLQLCEKGNLEGHNRDNERKVQCREIIYEFSDSGSPKNSRRII